LSGPTYDRANEDAIMTRYRKFGLFAPRSSSLSKRRRREVESNRRFAAAIGLIVLVLAIVGSLTRPAHPDLPHTGIVTGVHR